MITCKCAEQALKEHEIKYRSLFESARDAIFVAEVEGMQIIDANKRACQLTGYTHEELMQKTGYDLHPAEIRETLLQEIIDRVTNVNQNLLETVVVHKEGRLIPVEISTGQIYHIGDKKVVTGFFRDITERKNSEAVLHQERMFTEALLESVPGYLYVYDELGRLVRWNKKHEEMTGYTAEELSCMTLDNWFEGDDAIRVAAAVKEVFKTGYGEVEAHLLTKEGKKLHILSNGVRLCIGGKTYFTGVGLDITKQRNDEEELSKSEAKHKNMIANIADVITIVDEKGIIQYKSPNIKRLFGWNQEELVECCYLETAHPDDRDRLKKAFISLLSRERAQINIEYRYKNKDESYSVIELTAINLLNNPNIKGILANYHDITDRKKVEDALKMSEEKYRLITENASDVIWVLNLSNFKVQYISPSVLQLRGYTAEEAMNQRMEEVLTPESYVMAMNTIARDLKGFENNPITPNWQITEVQQPCKNGDIIWVEMSTKYCRNSDGVIELVGVSRNIEERKKAEREVLYLSYHDQLTGLYNRRYYEQELSRLDTERYLPITLVMADVNGLKLTNDAFGHSAGDIILQKVANILKRECRADEIVARIGGDEFVLLLPETDAKNANKIIDRINLAIANEKIDNVILSISMGFAVKNNSSDNMNEVFKKAEDDMYRHKLSESSSIRSKTIDLIMNSLYEKNNREMLHSKRVSKLCEAIATKMKFEKDDVNQIRLAGLMHDIGKIGINENILNKCGKLTSDEWSEIKRHSEIGYRILSSVNEFSLMSNYVLEHHERWDGKGYPKGIKGEEISIEARIIAVADAYDAMTSDRSYRKGLTEEQAVNEIRRCSGVQFDPDIVKIFFDEVRGLMPRNGEE